jgi:hypothetical protein
MLAGDIEQPIIDVDKDRFGTAARLAHDGQHDVVPGT